MIEQLSSLIFYKTGLDYMSILKCLAGAKRFDTDVCQSISTVVHFRDIDKVCIGKVGRAALVI